MRDLALLRSLSFRIAAGYTALFVVAVVLIIGAADLIATVEIRNVSEREILHDMSALRAAFREGGAIELRRRVEERSQDAPGDSFFLLLDAAGAFQAGNLPPSLWHEGWFERSLDQDTVRLSQDLMDAAATNSDNEVLLFSYGETLGTARVLVGRNSHILDEMQEIMLGCLVVGTLAISAVALTGGLLMGRGAVRRINAVAALTRQVVAGRFDLRLPVTRRGDEIDRLSLDVNNMLERLETLMESLRQVSTDIAHDLRTPLTRLRQRLEVLARQPPEPARFDKAITEALAESDAIIATFNALLRIAQVEAGARRARFQRLDASAVIGQVCDIYRDVATDAGHRFAATIAPDGVVDGDAELLIQLLANLIENAVTHVPPPGRIDVGWAPDGDGWRLTVADDGAGVPEAERAKIFRRLYRLDRSRSTPGSGLGLAMVAAIADLHGATIRVGDNRPGLSVTVTFPAAGEPEAPRPPAT